ncbi:hypothetical protein C8F01DRAFT_1365419 [Mycena amicta]|nr:hypothetical protein C8F01DRAFT_1365419 [Mycena amicta]
MLEEPPSLHTFKFMPAQRLSLTAWTSRNNEPVYSEQAKALIRDAILLAQQEISDIDTILETVSRTAESEPLAVQTMNSRRAELEEFVYSYRGAVTKIRELPLDVLLEIFKHFRRAPLSQFHRLNPLSAIIRTCSAWRNAALSYPALWSRITLRSQIPPERLLARIEFQLALLRGRSFRIEIPRLTLKKETLELLVARASQWQRASVCIKCLSFADLLLPQQPPFGQLRVLRLTLDGNAKSYGVLRHDPRWVGSARLLFPVLIELHLKLSMHHPCLYNVPVCFQDLWPILRVCTLEACHLRDVQAMLPLLARDTTLTLLDCRYFTRPSVPDTSTPTTLVSSLSVTSECGYFISGLFHMILDAPRLKSLAVSCGVENDRHRETILRGLWAFFGRLSSTLTHLRLHFTTCLEHDDELRRLFRALLQVACLRDLVDLSVSVASTVESAPNSLLHDFARVLGARPSLRLPALQRLALLGSDGLDIQMVETLSRRPSLKELKIHAYQRPIGEDLTKRLEKLEILRMVPLKRVHK